MPYPEPPSAPTLPVTASSARRSHTRQLARIVGYFVAGTLAGSMLAGAVIGLYLTKSAMGIDLMSGKSPLHDSLYRRLR